MALVKTEMGGDAVIIHTRTVQRRAWMGLRRREIVEITAAATIAAADGFGLPVSTTHVLSSGIAGTMAANGSGLQLATVRNIAMAWVLTLPLSVASAGLRCCRAPCSAGEPRMPGPWSSTGCRCSRK